MRIRNAFERFMYINVTSFLNLSSSHLKSSSRSYLVKWMIYQSVMFKFQFIISCLHLHWGINIHYLTFVIIIWKCGAILPMLHTNPTKFFTFKLDIFWHTLFDSLDNIIRGLPYMKSAKLTFPPPSNVDIIHGSPLRKFLIKLYYLYSYIINMVTDFLFSAAHCCPSKLLKNWDCFKLIQWLIFQILLPGCICQCHFTLCDIICICKHLKEVVAKFPSYF